MKYDDDVFEGGWPRAHVEILAYAAYNNSKFRLRHWIFKVPPIICCVRGGGAGVYNITLHFRHWPPPSKSNHARGLGLVVIVVKPSTGITALLLRSRRTQPSSPTAYLYYILHTRVILDGILVSGVRVRRHNATRQNVFVDLMFACIDHSAILIQVRALCISYGRSRGFWKSEGNKRVHACRS